MRLLFASATLFEIAPLQAHLAEHFHAHSDFHFQKRDLEVVLLVTGVGMAFTALRLGQMLAFDTFKLVVNAGVAGAFNRSLRLGEVVNVVSERFGDLGVEEADGVFTDLHELELIGKNDPPFQNGELLNPAAAEFGFLPKCKGLTVSTVHGFKPSIAAIEKKYPGVEIETMEGAAAFLACLLERQPFLEIRAISNYVEPRNRAGWKLEEAIGNLNRTLVELLEGM